MSVARAFEETPLDDELLTLPEETTDGTGPPPDTQLTRQVKKTGYACVRLRRTGDWEKYEKWELFKPYELAAKNNIHANDAHKNLNTISRYCLDLSVGGEAQWKHRGQLIDDEVKEVVIVNLVGRGLRGLDEVIGSVVEPVL